MSVIHRYFSIVKLFWDIKTLFIISRFSYFTVAMNRFYNKDLTVVPSSLAKIFSYSEMSDIKGVRYTEVPLY